MDRADWRIIQNWEKNPKITRVNEFIQTGPRGDSYLFAVRYFRYSDQHGDYREAGYYIPMCQPEADLIVFSTAGREWSPAELRRIGLEND